MWKLSKTKTFSFFIQNISYLKPQIKPLMPCIDILPNYIIIIFILPMILWQEIYYQNVIQMCS